MAVAGVEWARASRFNWVYDAMGGTPLMAAVAGKWAGATTTVGPENTIVIQAPLPGGGAVFYLRGVWRLEATFSWPGFWAEPEGGDCTNYFLGGGWENQGRQTVIRLGRPLPPGTAVQLYYLYLTGETAARYEALNSYPCIRRAWRGSHDYTFDYAVDRFFDLMAVLEAARREGRPEGGPEVQQLLWQEYYQQAASASPPLVWDDFERTAYDRGAYLIYYGCTEGSQKFGNLAPALVPGTRNRALRVELATDQGRAGASYWLGYGFNWQLTEPPFTGIDRLYFSWAGTACQSRVTDFCGLSAGGTARLRVREHYQEREPSFVRLTVTKGGAVGEAEYTFAFYRYGAAAPEKELTGLRTSDLPVALVPGVEVWWEADGTMVAGDHWSFALGLATRHPRRLQVVLNNAPPEAADPWRPEYTYIVALPDRFAELQDFVLPFSRFYRLDNLIFDADRRPAAWHPWCAGETAARPGWLRVAEHEVEAVIDGELYYTQLQLLWNLPVPVLALGFWTGLNPAEVNSQGQSQLDFLLKPEVAGSSAVSLTVKLKDSQGRYFITRAAIPNNQWSRLVLNFSDFQPEEAGAVLTHPITAVDLGLEGPALPQDGCLWLAAVKFGAYRRFPGDRLRLVEFKYQEGELVLPPFRFWLDNVGLNLEARDPFPYCPRLAISLTPWGRNPWRGPTLVHYAHPLGPYLVGRHDLVANFLALHRAAQEEYHRRYGGLRGPIIPVHTRNDVENIPLCGEENFTRFCWWSKYRTYGKETASWRFNETLSDASGLHTFTLTANEPVWGPGLCQEGNTSLVFAGTAGHAVCEGEDFHLEGDFTLELVLKLQHFGPQTLLAKWDQDDQQRSWVLYLAAGGYLAFGWSPDGVDYQVQTSALRVTDTAWHHIVVVREGNTLTFYLDGNSCSYPHHAVYFRAAAPLRLGSAQGSWPGYLNGSVDYVAVHKGRAMTAAEVAGRWRVVQGLENGSAYPEVGYALGQYWAFLRLAEFYFFSNSAAAWEILDHWLTWFTTFLEAEGSGWRLPVWFSEYGFRYGGVDPGAQASVAIGCLYVYLRRGDSRALEVTQKLLADLRQRPSGDYGGYLYKSDYHYAWLNALVAHAFGLAIVGRQGAAHRYPATPADREHFEKMIANFFACSGDRKPNLFNRDLIPFSYVEDLDLWDYAPHYVFMRQMGSLEAVVLMLQVALDWALFSGRWDWFRRLRAFLLRDNYCRLPASQIRSLTLTRDFALLKNPVRVFFGDYRRDYRCYAEQRDEAGISQWGPQPLELNLTYGQPVITEDPQLAATLARRLFQRFGRPQELVQLETWLAASRVEIKDQVLVDVPEIGYEAEPFVCYQKELDLERGRITLWLSRELQPRHAWAGETASDREAAYALESLDPVQEDWYWRSYVY